MILVIREQTGIIETSGIKTVVLVCLTVTESLMFSSAATEVP